MILRTIALTPLPLSRKERGDYAKARRFRVELAGFFRRVLAKLRFTRPVRGGNGAAGCRPEPVRYSGEITDLFAAVLRRAEVVALLQHGPLLGDLAETWSTGQIAREPVSMAVVVQE